MPQTAVIIRKMWRKPSYCQRLIISRPLAVSGPMNSTARPYISGRRVHSEPRQLIMAEPQLTPFEHILIGLVALSPASGYDLKRMFAVTPMGVYQPSSGSLYPALRRLE